MKDRGGVKPHSGTIAYASCNRVYVWNGLIEGRKKKIKKVETSCQTVHAVLIDVDILRIVWVASRRIAARIAGPWSAVSSASTTTTTTGGECNRRVPHISIDPMFI